jgi:hypothetical protein
MFASVFGSKKMDVFVNIYDLQESQSILNSMGLGTHHSGVQIGKYEYFFGSSGVARAEPRRQEYGTFKERVEFGKLEEGGQVRVNQVVAELRKTFPGEKYNLAHCNCNHFSAALIAALFPGREGELPDWLNRAARLGSWFYPSNSSAPSPVDEIVMPGTSRFQDEVQTQAAQSATASSGSISNPKAVKDPTKKKELSEKQKQLLANLKKNKA